MRPGGAADLHGEVGGELGSGDATDPIGAKYRLAIVQETTELHGGNLATDC
jgi:hypothetical protein